MIMPREQRYDLDPFLRALRRRSASNVLTDPESLAAYASDESPYQRLPAAALRPRDAQDVVAIAQAAAEFGVPLIPRGGGTSLAGQCVGDGVVVDMGWHQKGILRVDPGLRRVTVQPGITRDVINGHIAPYGLVFSPDPSSDDRCQVGGMVGNNAWGLHALRDGAVREHVVAMEVVLPDGTSLTLQGVNERTLETRTSKAGREGTLYRAVIEAVSRHRVAIAHGYPSMRGVPSNAGYALETLLRGQPWNREGPRFNLARLLCGAEGTLALVTSITLKLVEPPTACRLLCLHFDAVEGALDAVPGLLETRPAALELLDRAILRVAQAHQDQRINCFWVRGDPGAVLLAEYSGGSSEDVAAQAKLVSRAVAAQACIEVEGEGAERVWAVRRAALSMLMEQEGGLSAVTGIEDAAVAVSDLRSFYREVRDTLERSGLSFFVYGPVGMGLVHMRPVLRLESTAAIDTYEQLLDTVAAITVRYRGSFSAKHGDGRLRGKFLAAVLGKECVEAIRDVKRAFDPEGLLNPGKILDCPPLAADLARRRPTGGPQSGADASSPPRI